MLTDNYKKWYAFVQGNSTVSSTPLPIGNEIIATTLNGVAVPGYTHIQCASGSALESLCPGYKSHIYYGSGSTPASVTDTNLESPISPAMKLTSLTTVSSEYKNHRAILTVSSLATNISSSAITVRELVWLKEMKLSKGASASVESCSVVLAREVLEEPVTIEAGGTHTFEVQFIC